MFKESEEPCMQQHTLLTGMRHEKERRGDERHPPIKRQDGSLFLDFASLVSSHSAIGQDRGIRATGNFRFLWLSNKPRSISRTRNHLQSLAVCRGYTADMTLL